MLSVFPREFIHKRKHFAHEISDFLHALHEERNEADYDLKEFSEKTTKRLLDKTERIYNIICEAYHHEQKSDALQEQCNWQQELPNGVYIYRLKAKTLDGKEESKVGKIVVVR